jgi:biotin carboxyl carrier protein
MEHALVAPEAGRVAEVRAVLGRAVDQGQLLIRLLPEGDAGEETR